MQHLHSMAQSHHQWVDDMGWHNKTTLASLGLIGEEIGEAIKECRSGTPSERFPEEVADIMLRIMDVDISLNLGIFKDDLSVGIEQEKLPLQERQSDPAQTYIDYLTPLYALLGQAISTQHLGNHTLHDPLHRIVTYCFAITSEYDLIDIICQKMEKNAFKGTRGRTF